MSTDTAYAVVVTDAANRNKQSTGLTHVEAMRIAEAAQRAGSVARVMHRVGEESYEVDSYPPR